MPGGFDVKEIRSPIWDALLSGNAVTIEDFYLVYCVRQEWALISEDDLVKIPSGSQARIIPDRGTAPRAILDIADNQYVINLMSNIEDYFEAIDD
jgi:hypothetical protein